MIGLEHMSNQKTDTKTVEKTKQIVKAKFQVKLPKNHKVVLFNNHITAFEAVVDVLRVIFSKNKQEASAIMMHAHMNGQATVVSPVTKEIGEALVDQADEYCRRREAEAPLTMGRPNYYTELQFEVEEAD